MYLICISLNVYLVQVHTKHDNKANKVFLTHRTPNWNCITDHDVKLDHVEMSDNMLTYSANVRYVACKLLKLEAPENRSK